MTKEKERCSKSKRIPSIEDWELASVTELATLTSNGHAPKGCTTEVKVGATIGAIATRALVRYDDCDGPP